MKIIHKSYFFVYFLELTMSSLVIRPASISDVPSIVEVRLEALTEKEISGFTVPGDNLYSSIEELQKSWDRDNRLKDGLEVFVAVFEEKVVGFIVYNMESHDDNIDKIVVAKEEQRNGVGRALVEYVEELAKSRGFDFITTDTTENANGVPWKAYDFWKKLGYEDNGGRLATYYDFKVIPLVKRLK